MKFLETIEFGKQKQPKRGDIFAYRIRGHWGYLRIIKDNLKIIAPACLTYFYSALSLQFEEIPTLDRDSLLFPPDMQVKDSWRHGIFKFVCHRPIDQREEFEKHYFWDDLRNVYRNETGTVVLPEGKFCGNYGLSGLQAIETCIALGFGYITRPSDLDDIAELPNLKTALTDRPKMIQVSIPMSELTKTDSDVDTVELPLDRLCQKDGIGKWVETGTIKGTHLFSFEIERKHLKRFTKLARLHLRSLCIQVYELLDVETGEVIPNN